MKFPGAGGIQKLWYAAKKELSLPRSRAEGPFDFLRTICAFIVVFLHSALFLELLIPRGPQLDAYTQHIVMRFAAVGFISVEIFFFMSGFLLCVRLLSLTTKFPAAQLASFRGWLRIYADLVLGRYLRFVPYFIAVGLLGYVLGDITTWKLILNVFTTTMNSLTVDDFSISYIVLWSVFIDIHAYIIIPWVFYFAWFRHSSANQSSTSAAGVAFLDDDDIQDTSSGSRNNNNASASSAFAKTGFVGRLKQCFSKRRYKLVASLVACWLGFMIYRLWLTVYLGAGIGRLLKLTAHDAMATRHNEFIVDRYQFQLYDPFGLSKNPWLLLFVEKMYFSTLSRIGPFFAGALFAILVEWRRQSHSRKVSADETSRFRPELMSPPTGKHQRLKTAAIYAGHAFSIFYVLILPVLPIHDAEVPHDLGFDVFVSVLHPYIGLLCISWIIYAALCPPNSSFNFPRLRRFLNAACWIPVSRLSMGVFSFHFRIMVHVLFSICISRFRNPEDVDMFGAVVVFLWTFVLSLALSAFMLLVVEKVFARAISRPLRRILLRHHGKETGVSASSASTDSAVGSSSSANYYASAATTTSTVSHAAPEYRGTSSEPSAPSQPPPPRQPFFDSADTKKLD